MDYAGAAVPRRVLATFEAMLGDAGAADWGATGGGPRADRAAGGQGRRVKTAPSQTTLFSSRSSMVPRELARISGVLVAWRKAKR